MNRCLRLGIRVLLIAIILSAIAIGAVAVRPWLAARDAAAKIAALRADGQPVTLTDLARPLIPLDRNGATYLRRARHDLESMDQEWADADIQEHQLLKSQGKSEQEIYDTLDRENWPTAWGQRAFAATFAAYPAVIPLLERAAECDDFDWRFDFKMPADRFMESVGEFCQLKRQSARALRSWALLQATRHEPDQALQACTTLLRLARLYDQEPTLINHLVDHSLRGVAIYDANRILQAMSPSVAGRARLREELILHDTLEPWKHALTTDRAYGLTCFRDGVPLDWAMFDGHDLKAYLDAMQSMLSRPDEPFADLTPAARTEWQAACVSEYRNRAQVRCLLVLLALLDQPAVAGQTEVNVDDLNLPALTVTDPFNGGKIQLRKTADGWIVYTVGENLKDDGGDVALETMLDIGIGPPQSAKSPDENQRLPDDRD